MISRLSSIKRTKLLTSRSYTFLRTYSTSFSASDLTIISTDSPKSKPDPETLAFGKTFSDHMLVIEWEKDAGWGKPVIKPYDDLRISPAATGLHYGERENTLPNTLSLR